jgi:hypothetical protein
MYFHSDRRVLHSRGRPDLENGGIYKVILVDSCDRAIDGVHILQGYEACQRSDTVARGFAPIQQTWLKNRRLQRELVFIGKNVIIAQNVDSGGVADQSPKRSRHLEGIVRVAEAG